ncbi:MAG: hypothetical protein BYD32DRAFT_155529, partial [Podila humilis]
QILKAQFFWSASPISWAIWYPLFYVPTFGTNTGTNTGYTAQFSLIKDRQSKKKTCLSLHGHLARLMCQSVKQ